MFKKTFLICLLSISLTGLFVSHAKSGIILKYFNIGYGSLCAEALFTGLGDCDECASWEVNIQGDYAVCECCNGGGQCGGLGNPFVADDLTIDDWEFIFSEDMVAKGRYLSEICWDESYISDLIEPFASPDYCDQNDNWGPGNCILTQFHATVKAFSENPKTLVLEAEYDCSFPSGTPLPPLPGTDYNCTQTSYIKY